MRFINALLDLFILFRRQFFSLLVIITVCIALSVGFNYWGWKDAVPIVAFVFFGFILYLALSPRLVGALLAAETVAALTPLKKTEEAIEIWGRFLSWVMLVLSIFFLWVSTFDIDRNLTSVPLILFLLLLIFLIGLKWGIATERPKKIFTTLVVIILVYMLGSLIGGATWRKLVGIDPYVFTRVSEYEKSVDKGVQYEQKNVEAQRQKKLAPILKKLKKGENLSLEEQKSWDQAKVSTVNDSMFSITTNAVVEGVSSAIKKIKTEDLPASTSSSPRSARSDVVKIREPGSFNFKLKPWQDNGQWVDIKPGLSYSLSTPPKQPFLIRYKSGKTVEVRGSGVPIPDYAGPFRVQAQEKAVSVTILVSRHS